MLQTLRVSNFAVIEETEVTFGKGLTVFTGETGAGKSILVDALGLLLGGRSDGEVVRSGCEEATVEGVFENSKLLTTRLDELGLPDPDASEVCIRRVVGRNGRGKAYVNGALVTVAILGKVMKGLIDVAGQHEHMSLMDASNHLRLLDRLGQLDDFVETYQRCYQQLRHVDERLRSMGNLGAQARAEFIRFQLEEIERLAPEPGEDLFLEEERKRLLAIDRLRRFASEAEALLTTSENPASELLGRAAGLLAEGGKLDGGLADILKRVEAARNDADEAARLLGRYLDELDADSHRLMEVDERLDALKRLCRKHNMPLGKLLEHRKSLVEECEACENRESEIANLNAERESVLRVAIEAAARLSQERQAVATRFSKMVQKALGDLAMGKSEFSVLVRPHEGGEALGLWGQDEVEFFFSANPGEPQRPLAKVASGGEASRVLLALRAALAGSDECQCYVLDEADAGVGGAVAEVVGRMMKEVSSQRQVLCITHLPQVAAFADEHWLVEKIHRQGKTLSQVKALSQSDARTMELARMMSGVEVTREAFGAAQALVKSVKKPRLTDKRKMREKFADVVAA